jgi:Flp pilus assembly pilin Flp
VIAVSNFIHDDRGANLIDYAFIAGLMALACVVAVGAFTDGMQGLFAKAIAKFDGMLLP